LEQIEQAAGEIEQTLQNSMEREIPSARIGELAMEKLRASTTRPMCALLRFTVSSATSILSWKSFPVCVNKKNRGARRRDTKHRQQAKRQRKGPSHQLQGDGP
jgi:hypothetical protein